MVFSYKIANEVDILCLNVNNVVVVVEKLVKYL